MDPDTLQNALRRAVKEGKDCTAKVLLSRGADPNAANREGKTALHWAAMKGHRRLLVLLAEKKADLLAKDNEGRTARRWAEQCGQKESAELLRRMEAGEDPQAALAALERDLSLGRAAGAGDLQRLRALLSAEPAPTQDALNYALLQAAIQGKEDAVKVLLEQGAV